MDTAKELVYDEFEHSYSADGTDSDDGQPMGSASDVRETVHDQWVTFYSYSTNVEDKVILIEAT